jgi:hypothetical protein
VSTKSGPGGTSSRLTPIQGGQQPIDLLVGRFPVAKRVDVLDPAYLPLRSELVDLAGRPEVSSIETHHQLIAANDAPEVHRPRLQGLRVIADFSEELRLAPQAFLNPVGELCLKADRDALTAGGP